MINQEKINIMVKKLIETYQPRIIYLFGSYAWGLPDEDSDIDMLIVVKESSEKFHQRIKPAYRALRGIKVPKDILVYTEKEFEYQSAEPSSLLFKIKAEGVKLFEAA
jgi:predicted nucleotidyltransferase